MQIVAILIFTFIVSNSKDITRATIIYFDSLPFAEECARRTGLPLKMTAVWEDIAPELAGKVQNLLPMKLSNLQIW